MLPGVRAGRVSRLCYGQCLLGKKPGIGEAAWPVSQQLGQLAQVRPQMAAISNLTFETDCLLVALFGRLELAAFGVEESQLTPASCGPWKVGEVDLNQRRLLKVALRLDALPLFLQDLAQLKRSGSLHGTLTNLAKQSKRRAASLQRLLQIAFRQRERSQPTEVYALTSEVFQSFADLQRHLVGLLRIAELADRAQGVSKVRMQRGAQTLHCVA